MGLGFERASPALKEILLRMRMSGKPPEVDHCMYEFGSVEYRIQSSASDPYSAYLSVRMPAVEGGSRIDAELTEFVTDMAKRYRSKLCEIVEPATEGYELTIRINLAKIPLKKELQIISKIASVPALVLSSELKEHLRVNCPNGTQAGACKALKISYHPSQSFFVIQQPYKILIVYPMRIKEDEDVNIASAFLQELVDEGNSDKWGKALQCSWSPIPPSDLRGELFEDLSTNAGFISFDIYPQLLVGKNLDNITWTLLRFYTFVNYHIKATKCFVQRRMKRRLESLLQVLQETEEQVNEDVQEFQGSKTVRKLLKFYKSTSLDRRSGAFMRSIKRLHFPVRIRAFNCFRWRCWRIQKEFQAKRYLRFH